MHIRQVLLIRGINSKEKLYMRKKPKDAQFEGLVSKGMDFLDTSSDNVTGDEVLNYLASIIADIVLKEMGHDISDKSTDHPSFP